ncbi:MAG TPA: iron uptake system protein EfeO [Solirubrobacteraceae bacterium]|nr:iron uptake system protein EfeO [Solirubrobacteraceae bacterium]
MAACGSSSSSSSGGSKSLKFTLTDAGCTPGKVSAPAGPITVSVANGGSSKVTELELQDRHGIIIGERENIVPGITGSFSLNLQPGTYVLNCINGTAPPGVLTVTGTARPENRASAALLNEGVAQYRKYVEGESAQLVAQTRKFVAAIEQGNLKLAKQLYGPTRIHYEAVEPVAESFGGLDPAIDARIDDPHVNGDLSKWTGFHHIEQLMWAKRTLDGAAPLGRHLLANVLTLQQRGPKLELAPERLANGAVGLLNEVTNAKITGEEDRYSHTDLSDFEGNLLGARKAFDYLSPALVQNGNGTLATSIATKLDAVQKELDTYRRDTPLGFALYSELTQADKVRFVQQVGGAAQELSNVALKIAT